MKINTSTAPLRPLAPPATARAGKQATGLPAASRTESANAAATAKPTIKASEKERLLYAAREFSGFFISQFLKGMRNTVKTGELGHGGNAEKQFQALADDEYANVIGKSDFYGLTSLIYDSLARKGTAAARPNDASAEMTIANARRAAAQEIAATTETTFAAGVTTPGGS